MLKRVAIKYRQLSPKFQQQLSNISWLIAENFLQLGLGLIVSIWMARYLEVKQFGLYNYASSLVYLFQPLMVLGLNEILVREIVKDSKDTHELLGTTFILKLVSSIILLISCVGLIKYLRPHDVISQLLVVLIAFGNLFRSVDVIELWYQSQVLSKYKVISNAIAFIISSLLKVILIVLKAPLVAFGMAATVQLFLSSISLIVTYYQLGFFSTNWSFSITKAKTLLTESSPLILSSIAIILQARIDQVMLGQMIGDAEVGQYSVAIRLIEVFGFVPVILCQSVSPLITEAKLKSKILYFHRLENIYRIMFILFLVIAIPIFCFSEIIVTYLYGQEYQPAGKLLSLFAIRLFFTNFGVAKFLYITNESLFNYSLVSAILGSLTNILMNYILIPQFASVGALWATIASFAITVFLLDWFFPKMQVNLYLMIKAILTPWQVIRNWSR